MESSGVPFSLSLRLWEYHRHDRRIELPMHSHLFWQLNMAEAGTAEFVTPDAPPRELSAGALLFVPPPPGTSAPVRRRALRRVLVQDGGARHRG
ncbi:hypothetical protein [uncultured Victivallis sp.]|uniref:hypothetical protein n=1 Tax=uncultured Victivallis sp. TaxID=354118 RepID=UPI0025DF84C5|nr:hypothetical protein [uncultured Victivallis sp.]